MNIYDKAHELARAIRESEENREFKKIRNVIFDNEKNKELIKDFKVKQFEVQAEQLSGKEPDKSKIEQMQQLYGILTANPEIGKYFEAEYKFERVISDIYKILGEAIDIENDLIK